MKLCLYIMSVLLPLLPACTYIRNRDIKTAAHDLILGDVKKTLEAEQSAVIAGKNTRGKDFSKYVQDHTDIEIENIKEVTSTDVLVEVKMRSLTPDARQLILQMLARLDIRTANAFNFTEALGLIHQEKPELEIEADKNLSLELQEKNGNWVR